jgi:hypothetical protein
MASSLGSLLVSLKLDAAEFTSGMSRSEAQAAKFSKRMQADMDASLAAAKRLGAGVGVAAVAAAAGFAAMIKSQTEAVDRFNDLSDASGASIENISALDDIARRTGGTFETVETTVLKLNKALGDADGKNGVSQALKALGLNADELRKADPADAVLSVAKALDGYEGDANKARLTTEIFGKSTKDVAAFLKDLAEKGQLVGSVTRQQAEEVERYNKSLATLNATAADFARTVGLGMVPALNKALLILAELQKGPGLGAALRDVLTGGSFTSAQEALDGYRSRIADIDKQIARIKGDKRPLIQANAAAEIASLESQRTQLQKFATAYRNILNDGSAGAGRGSSQNPAKPSLPDIAGTKGGKSAAASFSDYATEISESVARMVDESAVARIQRFNDQLKELDALQAAGLNPAFLSDARAKVTTELVDAIVAKTEEASDAFRRLELNATKATNTALGGDSLQRSAERAAQLKADADALMAGNQALQDEIAIITGGEAARRSIEQARISSAIALKEEALAKRQNTDASGAELDAMRKEIDLLRERQGLLAKRNTVGDAVQQASELQKSFERNLSGTFAAAARGDFKSIREQWKQMLIQMAADAAAAQITKAIFGSTTGAWGGAGSHGGGGGSGSGINWISLIGSFFGGFFADGGNLGAGKWGIAGEKGPELIKGPANVIPMNRAMQYSPQGSMGGGVNITQYLTVQSGVSPNEMAQAMAYTKNATVAEVNDQIRRGRMRVN